MGGCLKKNKPEGADEDGVSGGAVGRHDSGDPARDLPAVVLRPPEPCAEGHEEVTVHRHTADERLGIHFRNGSLAVDRVNLDRAAARAGVAAYRGRVLTHCDGVPVESVEQYIAATQGKEEVVLRFAPASEDDEDDAGESGAGGALVSSIQVTVLSAFGLYPCSRGGTSDPYVVVDVISGGEAVGKRKRTAVKKKTLSPMWDERLDACALVRGHAVDAVVKCTVFDEALIGAPEFMGFAELPLGPRRLAEAVARDEEVTLQLGPRPGSATDEAMIRRRPQGLGWLRISVRAAMAENAAVSDCCKFASVAWSQGDWGERDTITYSGLELTVACAWDLKQSVGGAALDSANAMVVVSGTGALSGAWGQGAPRETRAVSKTAEPLWDQRFRWDVAPGAEEQGITIAMELCDKRKGEPVPQQIAVAELRLTREELRRSLVRTRGRKLPLSPVTEPGPAKSPRRKKQEQQQQPSGGLGTLMVVYRSAAAPAVSASDSDDGSIRGGLAAASGTPPGLPCRDDDAHSVRSIRSRPAGGMLSGFPQSVSATMDPMARLSLPVGLGSEVDADAEDAIISAENAVRMADAELEYGATTLRGQTENLHVTEDTLRTLQHHVASVPSAPLGAPPPPTFASPLRPLSTTQLRDRLAEFFRSVGVERDVDAILKASVGREDDLHDRLRMRWPRHADKLEFLRAHWLLSCGGFIDDRSLPLEERLRRSLAREGALRDCDRLLRIQHGVHPAAVAEEVDLVSDRWGTKALAKEAQKRQRPAEAELERRPVPVSPRPAARAADSTKPRVPLPPFETDLQQLKALRRSPPRAGRRPRSAAYSFSPPSAEPALLPIPSPRRPQGYSEGVRLPSPPPEAAVFNRHSDPRSENGVRRVSPKRSRRSPPASARAQLDAGRSAAELEEDEWRRVSAVVSGWSPQSPPHPASGRAPWR
eukprot:TRINITY_DN26336_c0_g1_i1.p1 TRINITY_DN26336_c0_g1~~TRINITY_DN26336_c0_g1_i1.p1  ORF type:complete len:934 (+),score=238.78 TRINITY_DN26336_c0_g1_i1:93-2894(+)